MMHCEHFVEVKNSPWIFKCRRVATRTQKRSCVHIENFDKNQNMVNLGHKVE
jgi:hypothetical protein